MNGYSYLEDTQELKLEPFREFYQTLAEAKLENYQDSIKLNEFIKPTLCTRQISQNPYPIRILPS